MVDRRGVPLLRLRIKPADRDIQRHAVREQRVVGQQPVLLQHLHPIRAAQDCQRRLGLAQRRLGRPGRAEELIAGVEDAYATAREEHPEFAGLTAAMGQFGDTAGNFYLTYPEDPKASFLAELGFEFPPEIAETVTANEGDARDYGAYSEEARVKDLGQDGIPPSAEPSPTRRAARSARFAGPVARTSGPARTASTASRWKSRPGGPGLT